MGSFRPTGGTLQRWTTTLLALVVATSAPLLSVLAGQAAGGHRRDVAEGFESLRSGTSWADGTTHGAWRSVFNGYGKVGIVTEGTKTLQLTPETSRHPDVTHAALVTSRSSFGDMRTSLLMRTVRQLREPDPNPWETAWFVWHYTDNTHFYYLTLKPNGWELGKADPAYPGAQRFLATGSSPSFDPRAWNKVRIRQQGSTMSVWAGETKLTTFTDRQRPYTRGRIGFYTEDASTRFDDVKVVRL